MKHFKHTCAYCGSRRKTLATYAQHVKKEHAGEWGQTGSASAAILLEKARTKQPFGIQKK